MRAARTVFPGSPGLAGLRLAEALGLGSRRGRWLWAMGICLAVFAAVPVLAWLLGDAGLEPDLLARNQPPSLGHLFGTDSLGRDMLSRTVHGLVLSLRVGLLAAAASSVLALVLGVASASLGRAADGVVSWLVDIFMTVPHMVLLILISFAVGGGARGVVIAVALTHWPALTRVIRAEVLQLRGALYVQTARRFGQGPLAVAATHMLPHLLPQFLIGLILLFPHAILHEAALSFLGVGLSPHTPAVGILLAESMRHLSTGYWWLGILPGAALLALVKCFDILGYNLDRLLDPKTSQE
ncbi:MAG: ABC transporter permease [Desulfovibrionaceae bacterium]|nr:ABC transporter permease [Desulfovibrionaceae bacterium]